MPLANGTEGMYGSEVLHPFTFDFLVTLELSHSVAVSETVVRRSATTGVRISGQREHA